MEIPDQERSQVTIVVRNRSTPPSKLPRNVGWLAYLALLILTATGYSEYGYALAGAYFVFFLAHLLITRETFYLYSNGAIFLKRRGGDVELHPPYQIERYWMWHTKKDREAFNRCDAILLLRNAESGEPMLRIIQWFIDLPPRGFVERSGFTADDEDVIPTYTLTKVKIEALREGLEPHAVIMEAVHVM